MIWALVVVILALCGLIAWMEYNNRVERSKFLNAVIAKDTNDMVNLEFTDKTKIDIKPQAQGDELVPLSDLSDDQFMDAIQQ